MASEIDSEATVSSAKLTKKFGDWQHKAMLTPVTITHHGRPKLTLLSVDLFRAHQNNLRSDEISGSSALKNAQLKIILNQITEGFIAFDKQLLIIDINPAAELYIGLTKDDLIGRDLRDAVPETRQSIAWGIYKRVLRTGETVDFKIKSGIYDGPTIGIQAFPYGGTGVGCIFKNLSPDEEARALRGRLDAMLAALVPESSFSLISLNSRGGIEAADNSFCKMTEFPEPKLLELLLIDIVLPRDRPSVIRTLNATIRDEKPKTVVVTIVTRDGRERRLRLNMNAVVLELVPEEIVVWVVDCDQKDVAVC